METLAAQYGFAAAFFNSDPELRALINQAVAGQWAVAKFQARFMNTKWYRSREASARQWADLMARDPSEAAAKIGDRKRDFADNFSQLGIPIDDATLTSLATQSLQWSWSPAQIKDIFASYVHYVPGQMGGTVSAVEAQVRKMANDFGVTPTQSQMSDWITGILSERYTEDNLGDFLKDMAKSRYAGMSPYLDMGMTVRQVAGEYVNSFSRILETPSDAIDLMDPLIQQALQGSPPAQNQPPQMKTLYEFEKSLRQDPRWLRTSNARDQMTNAAMNIGRDWGLIA